MRYQIIDGSVTVGGNQVFSHMDFEIKGGEKIAVVGRNGAGKTTLLRLIAGELELDRDDRRKGPGISVSRKLTVGMLKQQTCPDPERTVEEELAKACPWQEDFIQEKFFYQKEYDRLFTGFGFSLADKKKRLGEFSGGEQTKIALIRLLLERPDILLLDEPTNHLDLEAVQWLEEYLLGYPNAVVVVSHDRFFLDRTARIVYEAEHGRLIRYPGNYTEYKEEKRKRARLQQKAWERQQEEKERLEQVVRKFRGKASKSSFVRAKKKQMERLEQVEKPESGALPPMAGVWEPAVLGSKRVLEAEHLKIGYEKPLLEFSCHIRRGQKIGLIGANGAGKTTFLKTAAGLIAPLAGKLVLGNNITIGYFDQHSSEITSEKTVLEHFHARFPVLTEKEARGILASYLFGGKEAARRVCDLSGGEKARLVLAELLYSRPNFLILDEPTNHMDLQAKEVLEAAFGAYTGTMLFVSHDRYFISQVAKEILIFEDQRALYYPFGYAHYLERARQQREGESIAARVSAEDAALAAAIRAVPKAEHHRLRELPEQELYLDWALRLIAERMEPAGEEYGRLEAECEELERAEQELESFWSGRSDAEHDRLLERLKQARQEKDQAWQIWHELCLEWEETLQTELSVVL